MAKSIARGKALVAKLRADPTVRDPEALAAWAGRHKHHKGVKGSLKSGLKEALGKGSGENNASVKADAENKFWEKKNPENFHKPYLDKRTQDALRDDPSKINTLIQQKRDSLKSYDSGRKQRYSEDRKQRGKEEDKNTIRALEAFREHLNSPAGKKKYNGNAGNADSNIFNGPTQNDLRFLEAMRRDPSKVASSISIYEGLLKTGSPVAKARAKYLLAELRKIKR